MSKQRFIIFLGVWLGSACAKAEPGLAAHGGMFAPVGGLVALAQPEPDAPRAENAGRVALLPDSKIQWEIGTRLLDPSIGAADVVVLVKHQEVTLLGTVRSGAQADEVETAAWRSQGVVSVTNLVGLK